MALVLPPPVREDPLPKPKVFVREHLQKPGWDVPSNNLVQIYFDACKRHMVSANSGVAAELERRVRIMQPLPYHLVAGKTPEQQLEHLFQHLTPAGDSLVQLGSLRRVLDTINPSLDVEQAVAASAGLQWLLGPPSSKVSKEQFHEAVAVAAAALEPAAVQQGLLEALAFPPDVDLALLGRQGLLRAAFHHLDALAVGSLPLEDVQLLLVHIVPGLDLEEAAGRLPLLAKQHYAQVTADEFVEAVEAVGTGLSDRMVERAVLDVLSQRIRPPWRYDFSRTCLGPQGLPPLLEALAHDPAYSALDLSSCALRNAACRQLADSLAGHPCVCELSLAHNPISDDGGLALAGMLEACPRICRLNVFRTHLTRSWSRTHHDAEGPSPCEGGGPVLHALLQNRTSRRRSAVQVVKVLARHAADLKGLFFSLADRSGKVELPTLQAALLDIGRSWGFDEAALKEVVHSEKLLGTCGEVRDDRGVLAVAHPEFMQFLRGEDPLQALCHSIRHHRLQVKRRFYQLAAERKGSGPGSGAGSGGGARVSAAHMEAEGSEAWLELEAVKEMLQELAAEPGSGWVVALEDIQQQLVPALFGGVEAPGHQGFRLSWSAFFNRTLEVYNR